MATRYYIEQAPDRFYDEGQLSAARDRARRLSRKLDGVYVIAETYNPELLDYEPVGSIAYFGGMADAREGIFA